MAGYGSAQIILRILVLLVLILVMAAGGVIWFDYINLIDAKTVLAPLYRFIGREGRTQEPVGEDGVLSLDAERLAIRLEAEALREQELDKREQDLESRRGEIEQMAQEIELRQKALEDQENSFNQRIEDAETKERIVEQNARQLTGMPPEAAVGIINAMEDQDAIDVLRMTDEIARREGANSLVPYWMSLMPAERVAELQRKMVVKPPEPN
ncbi:MAG: flagellar protein FlbB [Treponema sp.]|jgi:flagellar protein FlbB|nr:flagellar protein FlbB [Treponema sp.]